MEGGDKAPAGQRKTVRVRRLTVLRISGVCEKDLTAENDDAGKIHPTQPYGKENGWNSKIASWVRWDS